ncbi:MAG: phosphatase PAP2 family protein [Actinomycetota bacterium]|nr:phosphatase PAP2 family protein [Actinomycetota bacterium]
MLLDSDPAEAVSPDRATTGRHFPSLGRWAGWVEAVAIFAAYEAFDFVRAQVQGKAGPSLHHAQQVVDVERWFGLFQEARIQGWMLASHTVIQLWDIYYGTIHFIVPPLALYLAYHRCPARYRHHRDALFILSLLAMACFWLWPLAPPRLLPAHFHFVDTASTIGGMGPADRGHLKDDNLYAAMPSLHIGWAAWSAVVLVPVLRSWCTKLAAVAYPVLTLTAVVVTANHFFLDAAGGLVVLGAGWLLATPIDRYLRPLWRPCDS